ncbi:MAG: nuclear transport factor 2 family protein [Rhodoglobus sp.]
MTDPNAVAAWVAGYQKAWTSNSPDDIRAIFTDDASYSGRPKDERSWVGIAAIVDGWIAHADEPGSFTFDWHPVALEGDTAVVQAAVAYSGDTTWDDIWVIIFAPDGRAREFTEWPIARQW